MNIKNICFINDTFTMECDEIEDEFYFQISSSLGWAKFVRIRPDESTFVATELHLAPEKSPCLPVQARCVLWSRKEALEAHLRISAYQESPVRVG